MLLPQWYQSREASKNACPTWQVLLTALLTNWCGKQRHTPGGTPCHLVKG